MEDTLNLDVDELKKVILSQINLTFQQKKQFDQWCIDCVSWQEYSFFSRISEILSEIKAQNFNISQKRSHWFSQTKEIYAEIKSKEKIYSQITKTENFPKYVYKDRELKGNIFRTCPAASNKTVCCNLKVLSLVNNCAMECSYCVLQNHYDEAIIEIPVNLKEKLSEIRLDPKKKYRICTGEYSDSLMWGNSNNILTDCCNFASKNLNMILEFKTKSSNIGFFLKNEVPSNICCSWSLNPQIIIDHEEKKTASLQQRLEAARKIADKGIKVGFHFHPMIYFQGWEKEYQNLVELVMEKFILEEVLWVSFGCVTLMKGFENKLRENYNHSKILQMETEVTQDGKITYVFDIRKKLYQNVLRSFSPWKQKVFQYLCMEAAPMWDDVMDYTYKSVAEFEEDFNQSAFSKFT